MRLAITGARGFVGRALVTRLRRDSIAVVAISRGSGPARDEGGVRFAEVDYTDLGALQQLFTGCDAVIHLAARAHQLDEPSDAEVIERYRQANVSTVYSVAKAAKLAGVRRVVLCSSIGVNGNATFGRPFTEKDTPSPGDPYAVSKLESESLLVQCLAEGLTDWVILRPPLVYGPGNPGNLERLIRLAERAPLLPLGALHEPRTLIALDNLIDALLIAAEHPAASRRIFVVGDATDVSVSTIMEAFLKGLERSSWRLLSVSPRALEIGASLLGKSTTWRKLSDSLQVDSSLFKTTTGWKQRVGTVEGLYRTAVEYRMMNGFFVKTRPLFVLRVIDIFTASFGLVLGLPVLLLIYLIGFFDTGSPLFFQERVGRSKQPFILVKFRTMRLGTASVASHLANKDSVTPFGSFLRRTKLDELPQLWNVLKGDMSLVGPRPGLFNQGELLAARDRFDIYSVRPGITGLAQVSGIDMSTPELLAQTDAKMISELNLSSYFRYVKQTIFGAGRGDAVKR